MRITSWLFLVLALALIGGLGGMLLSGGEADPRELLETALRRVDGPEPDAEHALEDLEFALRAAEAEADREVAGEILIARGRILISVEAFGPARRDLELVLDQYRPGDVEVQLQLVDIDVRTGELEAALERSTAIVERDRNAIGAWTKRGEILMRMSDERLEQCRAILESALSDQEARKAMALIERAAAMDPADPLRVSLLHGARSLFTPPDQPDTREVLKLADEASHQIALARVSLAQSFNGPLDRDAVIDYLELLRRAGKSQDAIDFGLAAVPQRIANTSPRFMETLARVLIDAGRPRAAGDVIQKHFNKGSMPGQSFYATWAEALYRTERWRELVFVCEHMQNAGDDRHRSLALFYNGMGRAHVKQFGQGRGQLERYVKDDPVEPVPGALADAWRTLAACQRATNQAPEERSSLLTTIGLEPDGDGEDYLRLYELVAKAEPTAFDLQENYLTHAVRLLPARQGELLPRWIEVGKKRLKSSGTDLELVLADLRVQGRTVPAATSGAYELFRLAELHFDARQPLAAIAACKRLLTTYPGFLPAIELHAEASRISGDFRTAALLLFERLHRAGRDAATLRRLDRLPPGALDPEQRLELMQLDPENVGRLEIARTLRDEGRQNAALAGLTALPLDPLGDPGLLLASELMVDVGRYGEALEVLAKVHPGSPEEPRALALAISAAVKLNDRARLALAIEKVATVAEDDAGIFLASADEMMQRGFVQDAKQLLALLDARAGLRSGAILLRLAACGLLLEDHQLVQDSLERAEAFEEHGGPQVGRLIAAIQSRSWSRLPLSVREVLASGATTTRVQAIVLAILDERTDEARRMLDERRRAEPREPLWRLLASALNILRGEPPQIEDAFGADSVPETMFTLTGGSGPRDPRPLLARLFALESEDWRPWAIADLMRTKVADSGSLWSSYLAARGLDVTGRNLDAERLLRQINRTWPTFAPAWSLLETLKLRRVRRFDHIEMVRLREDRRKALGRRPGEEAEELLTESWAQEASGNLQGALSTAERAVETDPDLVPALYKLGQLRRRLADWGGATEAFHRASALCEVTSNSAIVEEFVEMLGQAQRSDPSHVGAAMVYVELDELARRFPDDPLVSLALAKAELASAEVSPAVGVARAYDRLDRFRTRIDAMRPPTKESGGAAADARAAEEAAKPGPLALESLRGGSSRLWKDFYQSLEPARAESFVRRELRLRPGSVDLWLMLGETFEAQDRRREAIELYELVQRMVPDGKTRRAIAALLASSGADPARVEQNIAEACRLEKREAPDIDMLFILARALVSNEAEQNRGIETLSGLWSRRDAALGKFDELDLAQLYGTALVQRADPNDRKLAFDLLSETAPRIAERSRRNLVEALANLAAQIPMRVKN